ncbi:MAG: hypothetical protein AAB701_02790, partial [Patescibacteria group bacterium]
PAISRAFNRRVEEVRHSESKALYIEFDGVEYLSVACAQELVKILAGAQCGSVQVRVRRLLDHVLGAVEQALILEKLYLFVAEPDARQTAVLGDIHAETKRCFRVLSRQMNATPTELARQMRRTRTTVLEKLERLFTLGLIHKLEFKGQILYSVLPISIHSLMDGLLLQCYQLVCARPTTQPEISATTGKNKSSTQHCLRTLCKLALIQKDGTARKSPNVYRVL